MAPRMSLTILSMCMSVLGIIFSCLGTFLKEWWIDETGKTHGLLTMVSCQDYICQMDSHDTDGWIVFLRVTSYAQFVLFILALVITAVGRLLKRAWLTNVAMGVLGVTCLVSLLNTFTALGYYADVSEAVRNKIILPQHYLLYQTLPVGMNAIAGTFCVPGFISLAIRQTKEKAGPTPKNLVV